MVGGSGMDTYPILFSVPEIGVGLLHSHFIAINLRVLK